MPKQKINHSTPAALDEKRFDLVVGWNRDMDVQVGIATADQPDGQHHLIDHVYGDPQTIATIGASVRKELTLGDGYVRYTDEQIGRTVLDAVTGSTPFGESVWWHPSRQMINDLIRALRKARDAAFGTDA